MEYVVAKIELIDHLACHLLQAAAYLLHISFDEYLRCISALLNICCILNHNDCCKCNLLPATCSGKIHF
jgi:hypothetical protein